MADTGVFTIADVMLTIRPKPRATMPSITARIISTGASMLASSASIQAARSQSWNRPGGGPPLLFTRMSGSGQARSSASWVSGSAMSPSNRRHLDVVAAPQLVGGFGEAFARRAR